MNGIIMMYKNIVYVNYIKIYYYNDKEEGNKI